MHNEVGTCAEILPQTLSHMNVISLVFILQVQVKSGTFNCVLCRQHIFFEN